MKRTFFEHLGIAHLEKIHTQTISWIFSIQNDGIDKREKQKLIAQIFDIQDFDLEINISEIDNIDLVLISKNTIICIENKLNSSLHSNQLDRYEESIIKKYPHLNHKFYLLSLINEKKKGENWRDITYSNLLQSLKAVKINSNANGNIIKEYIQTIENFEIVLNDFINNPLKYSNVFNDGYKSKSIKLNQKKVEGKQAFIRNNQLETIFQKLYFQKVADKLNLKDYYIDETRGNAILGINYYKKLKVRDKEINIGFDFQGGTFKIYCAASNYKKSTPKDVPNEVINVLKSNGSKLKGYRFNKPKSRGHYSLTKRRKNIFGIELESFAKKFENEMLIAEEVIERELIHTLANNDSSQITGIIEKV